MKLVKELQVGKCYIGYVPPHLIPEIPNHTGSFEKYDKAVCVFRCDSVKMFMYELTMYRETTPYGKNGRQIAVNKTDIFNSRNYTYELSEEEVCNTIILNNL